MIVNIFNVKQAELKESFVFQISSKCTLNPLAFLRGEMVKVISLVHQNQFPRFIWNLNIKAAGCVWRIMSFVLSPLRQRKKEQKESCLCFV